MDFPIKTSGIRVLVVKYPRAAEVLFLERSIYKPHKGTGFRRLKARPKPREVHKGHKHKSVHFFLEPG